MKSTCFQTLKLQNLCKVTRQKQKPPHFQPFAFLRDQIRFSSKSTKYKSIFNKILVYLFFCDESNVRAQSYISCISGDRDIEINI